MRGERLHAVYRQTRPLRRDSYLGHDTVEHQAHDSELLYAERVTYLHQYHQDEQHHSEV